MSESNGAMEMRYRVWLWVCVCVGEGGGVELPELGDEHSQIGS